RPGEHVARRRAQALRPEDRRGVEDEVPLRPRIDRGGPLLRLASFAPGCAAGDHFQPVNVRRVAVVLPTDEPRNAVSLLHAGAGEDPMIGPRDGPVAAAVDRMHVASADQVSLVRPAMRKGTDMLLAVNGMFVVAPVGTAAENDPVGFSLE